MSCTCPLLLADLGAVVGKCEKQKPLLTDLASIKENCRFVNSSTNIFDMFCILLFGR